MAAYFADWIEPFKVWCLNQIEERRRWMARLESSERIGEGGEDVTEEIIESLREEIANIEGAIAQADAHAHR